MLLKSWIGGSGSRTSGFCRGLKYYIFITMRVLLKQSSQVCVSLIQANLFSLGQILQLLLQSFMSSVTSPKDSADSAGVLQLFLETYFMELLGEDGEKSLDADQQQVKLFILILVCNSQALLTLLRSYLAGLSHPLMGTFMEVRGSPVLLYCAGLCSAHWPW